MTRFLAGIGAILFLTASARGQSSLDELQKDVDQLNLEHKEISAKDFNVFLTALETAQSDPAAAEKLYLAAGGTRPTKAKIITGYEHETPTEAAAREAVDTAEMASFDGTLELQCGLMKYGGLFIEEPTKAGLEADWLGWLKSAAQIYPQVTAKVSDPRVKHHASDTPEPDFIGPIKGMPLAASPISAYLGFHGWEGKEEGGWSVASLPELYQKQVLEPLRVAPTADTLAAWDVYIAMKNADEPDAEKWTDVDYPALLFEKDSDDFTGLPSVDKVEALVTIIKQHPTHPLQDKWLSRVHDMILTLKKMHPTQAASDAPAPASTDLPPIQPDSTNNAPATATTVTPPATNTAPPPAQ